MPGDTNKIKEKIDPGGQASAIGSGAGEMDLREWADAIINRVSLASNNTGIPKDHILAIGFEIFANSINNSIE